MGCIIAGAPLGRDGTCWVTECTRGGDMPTPGTPGGRGGRGMGGTAGSPGMAPIQGIPSVSNERNKYDNNQVLK